MNEKKIKFRDPVVERVVDKFIERSDTGYEKYGRTLDSERMGKYKDLLGYLNDVQEELMDAVLYIQAAREELMSSEQVTWDKNNFGHTKSFYGNDHASSNT